MRPVIHPQPAHAAREDPLRQGDRRVAAAVAVNRVDVTSTTLEVEALGVPAGWRIRHHLVIPLDHVLDVSHDPASVDDPDASAPGQHGARRWVGMFLYADERSFWNIDGQGRTVVITTAGEYFTRLFLTVAEPDDTLRMIDRKSVV